MGRRLLADRHLPMIDAVPPGFGKQRPAVRIIADQADRRDRQPGVELPDGDRKVARRSAAAPAFMDDLGQPVLGRPVADQLCAIQSPGAGGENAFALHVPYRFIIKVGKAPPGDAMGKIAGCLVI
jgi:hypothetical protein